MRYDTSNNHITYYFHVSFYRHIFLSGSLGNMDCLEFWPFNISHLHRKSPLVTFIPFISMKKYTTTFRIILASICLIALIWWTVGALIKLTLLVVTLLLVRRAWIGWKNND